MTQMTIIHVAMGMPEFDRAAFELGHRCLRMDWGSIDHDERQRQLIDYAIRLKPDVIFMQLQNPGVIDPSTLKAVRETGAMVINWTGDVRDPIPQHYIDLTPHVDITAFTNHTDVESMRAMGYDARFLQIGYDPLIYNTDHRMATRRVVFVGNDYVDRFPLSGERRSKVRIMQKMFPHEFAAYGKGFGKLLRGGDDAKVYRTALVAINLDHFDRPGFHSDRLLRSRACGAYTIDGTALSDSGLVDYVRAALNDPEHTERLGLEQAAHTFANDRWHNRIQVIQQWHAT